MKRRDFVKTALGGMGAGLWLLLWAVSGLPSQVRIPGPGGGTVSSTSTARHFGGVDTDYLTAADSASLESPSSAITVAFWFEVTSATQHSYAYLLQKFDSTQVSYGVYQNSSTAGSYIAKINIGGSAHTTAATTAVSLNTWYFAVLTWASGGPLTLAIYNADGTVYSSKATTNITGTIGYDAGSLFIGRSSATGFSFTGNLTNIWIDDTSIGSTDRDTLRTGVAPFTASGLWAPFLGNSPESDQSGNGNNLTVNGTTVVAGP
jgi:Concanavalin A-like lectin/glucanases superfamily